MNRLILIFACIFLAGTGSAIACSQDPELPIPSQRELFQKASSVFAAHLTRTTEVRPASETPRDNGEIEAEYRLIEVLKGKPPADGKVRSWVYRPGNCTVAFVVGIDYIFFVDNDFMNGDDRNFIYWPSGTSVTFDINSEEAQRMMSELRALKEN